MNIRFIQNFFIIIIPTLALGAFAYYYSSPQTTLEYSKAKVLVTLNIENSFDPSNAIRGAEKVASNLAQIIPSEKFLSLAIAADPSIQDYLPEDKRHRRDTWRAAVNIKTNASFIDIETKHPDWKVANKFTSAIVVVLNTQLGQWYSSGENLNIITLDEPLATRKTTGQNKETNGLIGSLTGLVLASAFIAYRNVARKKKVDSYI